MNIQGKQTPLPVTDRNDEAGAWRAFQALLAKAQAATARPEPVAELVSVYLDSISHRIAPKTRADYAIHLRRLVALFGSSAAGQIDPAALEKSAAKEGWSDSHRANYLWTVQAFLRWAGCRDLKLARPAKESRGADAAITADLHRAVLREVTGDFHALCELLWTVGCRPMEGAGLTAELIDWTTGTATLRRHKTKHKGKVRVLYFSAEALAILRRQVDRHKTGPLFRGQGGRPLTRQAIVCRFLRVSAKIGRTVTAYGYRHGFITRALAKGIPDTHVAALVGHTSTTMLHKFYSHVGQDAKLLRETAERVAG